MCALSCQLQGLVAVLFLVTFNKCKPLLLCTESSKAIITIKEGGWFMFTLGFTILGQTGKIFMVGWFWLVFLVFLGQE